MIVNKKKIKTLICVLGQTRAQDITWESFNKHLLESLGADLALCVAEEKIKTISVSHSFVVVACGHGPLSHTHVGELDGRTD